MTKKRWLFSGLMLALALPVRANDTSFSLTGGVPRIQAQKQVSMMSEKLEFRFVQPPAKVSGKCPSGSVSQGVCKSESYWQADLSYTFLNRGHARTLNIGLPFDIPECNAQYDVNGPCLKQGVSQLTTTVDGQPFKVSAHHVKITQPAAFNRVYMVKVPFAKGQTRVLRHRYKTYGISSVAGERFRYLLRTGSTWAGPIGRADIAFELPPNHGPCVTANLPHAYDGRWLKVGLNNWTPDRDQIDLLYGARPSVQTSYGQAMGQGVLPICRSADYFGMIQSRDSDFMPHLGLSSLRFLPDAGFPGNMSPLLKACVQALRQP
jgi:hypothetical protein